MQNYIRDTGIKSVRDLLKNLHQHNEHPRDAIRMIDRTIGGLLAHTESPSYNAYRDYAAILFPSGLEATLPGKDIILILNSKEVIINRKGSNHAIQIPYTLKNPEKGVAQIIGQTFARTLFIVRGEILAQLMTTEQKCLDWQINAAANDQALAVLKNYIPYPSIFYRPVTTKPSILECLFPCVLSR